MPRWSWPAPAFSIPGCGTFLPTAPIAALSLMPRSIRAAGGRSRWLSAPMPPGIYRAALALVVERTFAWLNRNRRLAKDFEATIESALAWLFLASVKLLMRRIARTPQPNVLI